MKYDIIIFVRTIVSFIIGSAVVVTAIYMYMYSPWSMGNMLLLGIPGYLIMFFGSMSYKDDYKEQHAFVPITRMIFSIMGLVLVGFPYYCFNDDCRCLLETIFNIEIVPCGINPVIICAIVMAFPISCFFVSLESLNKLMSKDYHLFHKFKISVVVFNIIVIILPIFLYAQKKCFISHIEKCRICSLYGKALKGNCVAQYNLGTYFYNKDNCKSYYWMNKSAAGSYPFALNSLGYYYMAGIGVRKNKNKSVSYWVKSFYGLEKEANLGNSIALYELARNYENGNGIKYDKIAAYKLYKKASDLGLPVAQVRMAEFLFERKSYRQAMLLLNKASCQGNDKAQYLLGVFYFKGISCKINYKMAAYFFYKSAVQKNDKAEYLLGVCYDKGLGVTRSYYKALLCYLGKYNDSGFGTQLIRNRNVNLEKIMNFSIFDGMYPPSSEENTDGTNNVSYEEKLNDYSNRTIISKKDGTIVLYAKTHRMLAAEYISDSVLKANKGRKIFNIDYYNEGSDNENFLSFHLDGKFINKIYYRKRPIY